MGSIARLALLATLISGVAAPARAHFVVAPMELHLDVRAGGSQSADLFVTNRGTEPLTVRIDGVDSLWNEDGVEATFDPGTTPRSCAAWVALPENVLEVPPGETRSVTVTLNVPPGAQGSFWSKLLVEEISSPQVQTQEYPERVYHIFMRQRVGVRIFQNVPGTDRPDALITNVVAVAEGDAPPSVTVRVENPSNSILRCDGHVELRDERGAIAAKVPLGSLGRFVIFPDAARNLVAQVSAPLAPGIYTALAIVDFGGPHLIAGDTVFEVAGSVIVSGDDGP